MKNLVMIILACLSADSFAQIKKSCCGMSSTEQFAMLATNESFAISHHDPLPLNFTPSIGTMIQYTTEDGMDANAFVVRAHQPTNNWIIMVHEWWGLNDYIKQEAEKLQSEIGNAHVLAVDAYDGQTASVAADAQKLMGELKQERAVSIMKGAIRYTGSNSKLFTIGWCFGGGWSLQASMLAGVQAAGCVMYYGMPETDLTKLKSLETDVLGIFARKDRWINEEVVNKFTEDMKYMNKNLTVKWYNADHAFANPSNPNYNHPSADEAHKIVLAFFKSRMK